MNGVIGPRPPAWFRLLSVLALLWSLIGVGMYLLHVGVFGDPTANLSEAERQLAADTPVWVTAAFAIATFAAAIGSLGLILLKRWARPLLVLSLVAVLIQDAWVIFMSDAREVHGLAGIAMPALVILAGVLLVWLATAGVKRGWLR